MHWTSQYSPPQPLDIRPGTPPPTSIDIWSLLDTCLNLFMSGPPPPTTSGGGYWSMYRRLKLAVHILPKCFLVCTSWYPYFAWLFKKVNGRVWDLGTFFHQWILKATSKCFWIKMPFLNLVSQWLVCLSSNKKILLFSSYCIHYPFLNLDIISFMLSITLSLSTMYTVRS